MGYKVKNKQEKKWDKVFRCHERRDLVLISDTCYACIYIYTAVKKKKKKKFDKSRKKVGKVRRKSYPKRKEIVENAKVL
jgi:hypothetical protein